ncbi:MAG: hypothetical protein ABJN40_13375 [Sneathiella sp.]
MILQPTIRSYTNDDHSIVDHQYPSEVAFMQPDMDQLMLHLYSDHTFKLVGGLPDLNQLRNFHQSILFNVIDRLPDVNSFMITQYDNRTLLGRDLTRSVVAEWDNMLEAEVVGRAYQYSRESKLPRLAFIEKTDFGITRSFLQVVWPLSEDGEVTQFLTAARYISDFKITPGVGDRGIQIGPYKIRSPLIRSGREDLRAIKTKHRAGMPIYPVAKASGVQLFQVVADNVINTIIN